MNLLKKLLVMLIIIFLFCPYSFADDTSLDDLEFSEITTVSGISNEAPETYSKNIVVIDRKTLSILYEKNPYEKVPMASTTKIMTCIIALENCSLNETVSVSKNSATVSGSTLGLISDMQISMNDLLYGLMLRSRK